jgi:uncharacterized phosphosugar-binding protein
MEAARQKLEAIVESQGAVIDRAAAAVVRAITGGGMVYLFGTGHSHMLAEEGHYRAGGLVPVCPILSTALMLHEGAVTSTALERTSGLGPALLNRYHLADQDVLFIFSNSGVNTVPVEVALAAKERGVTLIAVIAKAYAAQAKVGPTGRKLGDLADIVIDNQGPPGDALVDIGETGLKTGPFSTVGGAFILNAILTEAAYRMAEQGQTPPVYISANMPGAAEHNAALIEKYRARNPHL